eukprot:TRINITY_DN4408_c0_g1_i11.p3 TRINITY_DN4408_c0_g1~~TRINITY_DN4408_c0_g1_i11.p3  ORF type:complete len:128 (+),score=3.96 TRINITY_DN4408_c0_g1_i11:262-645(+)
MIQKDNGVKFHCIMQQKVLSKVQWGEFLSDISFDHTNKQITCQSPFICLNLQQSNQLAINNYGFIKKKKRPRNQGWVCVCVGWFFSSWLYSYFKVIVFVEQSCFGTLRVDFFSYMSQLFGVLGRDCI